MPLQKLDRPRPLGDKRQTLHHNASDCEVSNQARQTLAQNSHRVEPIVVERPTPDRNHRDRYRSNQCDSRPWPSVSTEQPLYKYRARRRIVQHRKMCRLARCIVRP